MLIKLSNVSISMIIEIFYNFFKWNPIIIFFQFNIVNIYAWYIKVCYKFWILQFIINLFWIFILFYGKIFAIIQDFFITIYKIFAILQSFSILIIAKNLLKSLSIFFKASSCLAKGLVKELLVFFLVYMYY